MFATTIVRQSMRRWVRFCLGTWAFSMFFASIAAAGSYPLSPDDLCGSTLTCQEVVDLWNTASRADLVDDDFNTGSTPVAAVRWYTTEGTCTGSPLCDDQLNNGGGDCSVLNTSTSFFCGVTDELSNVLLSHAMGSDQVEYEKLHNFSELLRHPSSNDLQCWKYYVQGDDVYDSHDDVCVVSDSASDASLRILLAYGIACAKQTSGVWTTSSVDYCTDYVQQGNAIWGNGTASHGEIKLLTNGEYFLANGYNNQVGAPTNNEAFRPDYYELQALMDFAEFIENTAFQQGVIDMLEDYRLSTGDNHIHCGTTGHFDAATTVYTCDHAANCTYMDNIETWRAIPALSGLLLVHPETVPSSLKEYLFDWWWSEYAGGHPSLFGPSDSKPMEIFCNSADGEVRQQEESYKTLGMWIPLGAAYDATYTQAAVDFLVDNKYDPVNDHFFGATYYGGYFSQFCQRAIGTATGMIDPSYWRGVGSLLFSDGFESGDLEAWFRIVP